MTSHLTVLPAPPDEEEAKRQAWTIIMGAAKEALTIPGLPAMTRSRLAGLHHHSARVAGRRPVTTVDGQGAA